jgi:hypothetical protein
MTRDPFRSDKRTRSPRHLDRPGYIRIRTPNPLTPASIINAQTIRVKIPSWKVWFLFCLGCRCERCTAMRISTTCCRVIAPFRGEFIFLAPKSTSTETMIHHYRHILFTESNQSSELSDGSSMPMIDFSLCRIQWIRKHWIKIVDFSDSSWDSAWADPCKELGLVGKRVKWPRNSVPLSVCRPSCSVISSKVTNLLHLESGRSRKIQQGPDYSSLSNPTDQVYTVHG